MCVCVCETLHVSAQSNYSTHVTEWLFGYVARYIYNTTLGFGARCGRVVKVLCYKSECRWFDARWCHWNFSLM